MKVKSMSWYIHHVNLQAHNVRESADFFCNIVGLPEGEWTYPERVGHVGHSPETIAFFGTQNQGLHIVKAITSFARDNNLTHNPTIGGHFAICVPDVKAVKTRLEAQGIVVSDAGVYAMAGMHQIYCYDPSMNVVEINEVVDPTGGQRSLPNQDHPVRREPGDWYIHHINRQVHDIKNTADFYELLIGMKKDVFRTPGADKVGDFDRSENSLIVFGPENRGLHLVRGMPTFHTDNNFMHNPTFGGHVAITVPDVKSVMSRMDKVGHLYSDAGTYAMAGMHQVYTYDPSMNFIEINQEISD
jgi:catechol 2,3-dioxygenase-like lactoylglutathione lyase family enzyme